MASMCSCTYKVQADESQDASEYSHLKKSTTVQNTASPERDEPMWLAPQQCFRDLLAYIVC